MERWHEEHWHVDFREIILHKRATSVDDLNVLCAAGCGLMNAIPHYHHNDVIMSAMASQITSLMIVYLTVYSAADQRKHQNFSSLAFEWGIHRWPVISPHTWPVTRKMFPFDGVIMNEFNNQCCARYVRQVLGQIKSFPYCWPTKDLSSNSVLANHLKYQIHVVSN